MRVVQVNEKYKTSDVFLNYNYDLQPPKAIHMFQSYHEITLAQAFELEITKKDEINNKKLAFNLMSEYARVDTKNYLNSRRRQAMSNDEAKCTFATLKNKW